MSRRLPLRRTCFLSSEPWQPNTHSTGTFLASRATPWMRDDPNGERFLFRAKAGGPRRAMTDAGHNDTSVQPWRHGSGRRRSRRRWKPYGPERPIGRLLRSLSCGYRTNGMRINLNSPRDNPAFSGVSFPQNRGVINKFGRLVAFSSFSLAREWRGVFSRALLLSCCIVGTRFHCAKRRIWKSFRDFCQFSLSRRLLIEGLCFD